MGVVCCDNGRAEQRSYIVVVCVSRHLKKEREKTSITFVLKRASLINTIAFTPLSISIPSTHLFNNICNNNINIPIITSYIYPIVVVVVIMINSWIVFFLYVHGSFVLKFGVHEQWILIQLS